MAATTDSEDGSETILEAARDAVRIERRRVIDEREAFEAFRTRVRSIGTATGTPTSATDAHGPPTAVGVAHDARIGGGGPARGSGLVAVRDAYEETVMSVPHYGEEYDDTYERSLAAEFGPELALALTRESALHPAAKRSLLAEADAAIDARDSFLDTVEAESASVQRATSRLLPIVEELATLSRTDLAGEDFGALDAYRARAGVLVENCEAIAARRQREIDDHGRSVRLGGDVSDLPTYLYAGLSVTYPVLATVGSITERIEAFSGNVERAMSRAQ